MSIELTEWNAKVERDIIQFQFKFRLPSNIDAPVLVQSQCDITSQPTPVTPPPKTISRIMAVCTPKGNDCISISGAVKQPDAISQYDLKSPKKPSKNPNRRNSIATYPPHDSPEDDEPDLPVRGRSQSSSRVSHFTHSTFHLTQLTPLSRPSDDENGDGSDPVVVLWDSVRKHGKQPTADNEEKRHIFLDSQSSSRDNQIALCSPGSAGQGNESEKQRLQQDDHEFLVDKSTSTSDQSKVVFAKKQTQRISMDPSIIRSKFTSYKPDPIPHVTIWRTPNRLIGQPFQYLPPKPFKDFWVSMEGLFPCGSEIWKGWDRRHYPPLGCHEIVVILENGGCTNQKISIFARKKDSEWMLSGRFPLPVPKADSVAQRACIGMMEWINNNGWWLTLLSATTPQTKIYLDTGYSPHTTVPVLREQNRFFETYGESLLDIVNEGCYRKLSFRFEHFGRLRAYLEMA